jgi:hypothetical protein
MTIVCYALEYCDVFMYNLKSWWRSVVAYSLQVLSIEEMYILHCPLHLLWMELETSVCTWLEMTNLRDVNGS